MAETHTLKLVEGNPSSTIGTRMFIAPPVVGGGDMAFAEITSITSIGELGGDANDIDVTTLKQTERSYAPGVKDFPSVDVTLLMEDKEASNADNYSSLRKAELSGDYYTVDVLFPNKRGIRFTARIKTRLNGAEVDSALTFVASFYKKGDSKDVTWEGSGSAITVTEVTAYN